MNVDLMHILVNERAQGLGPSRFDDFLAEEIDNALNLAQEKKLKQSYGFYSQVKPLGHEQSERRVEEIRSAVYRTTLSTYPIQEGEHLGSKFTAVAAKIPTDLMFVTNIRAHVQKNPDCSTVTKTTTVGSNYSYVLIDMPDLVTNYDNFKVYASMDIAGITDITLQTVPTGITQEIDIVTWLTSDLYQRTLPYDTAIVKLYWERYDNMYHPNKFIGVLQNPPGDTVYSVVFKNTAGAPILGDFPIAQGPKAPSAVRATLSPSIDNIEAVRFVQQGDLGKVLFDPFSKPNPKFPIYVQSNDEFVLYESGIYVIPSLFLSYVAKPRRISLPLGFNCVLPEFLHEEIVDEAVQILLSETSNPRVQQQSQDILRHE